MEEIDLSQFETTGSCLPINRKVCIKAAFFLDKSYTVEFARALIFEAFHFSFELLLRFF